LDLSGAVTIGTDPELYQLREAGRRMADVLNLAVIGNGIMCTGRWMAFSLDDGSSNKDIYDTRDDAMRLARGGPKHFEQLRPTGYSADECALTLQYARAFASSTGLAMDRAAPAPIMPVRAEDAQAKLRQLQRHATRRTRRRSR
jgi:hypothetical protein